MGVYLKFKFKLKVNYEYHRQKGRKAHYYAKELARLTR